MYCIVHVQYNNNYLYLQDVDIRSLPSFNKRKSITISDPSCRISDNEEEEVLIISETEVTSTVESEKPSHRRKVKFSTSSLPSTSSVNSAHNPSINEVDSTSSSQLINSSSDQSNNALKKFTSATQEYYSSVKNNSQICPSNNPFKVKKVIMCESGWKKERWVGKRGVGERGRDR